MRNPYKKHTPIVIFPSVNVRKDQRYSDLLENVVSPKYMELKAIFKEEGKEMDWEGIVSAQVKELDDYNLLEGTLEECTGNVAVPLDRLDPLRLEVQQSIIKKCEAHELIKTYNKLNKEFESRVKDENREMDVKNRNEKRGQKSLQEKLHSKKRGVEATVQKQD